MTAATVRGLVVAIDGPGSSGKSSVGAAAAARVGYRFCDTGLLYRAVTWLALRRGVSEADAAGLVGLAAEVELRADDAGRLARVAVGGEDVTAVVHGPDVDQAVSAISRVPELRTALLARQRTLAAPGRIVVAGRDIGTVVLPDADLKLFLDASIEERAARRIRERGLSPGDTEAGAIVEGLRRRDELDRSRPVAPLRAAPDAIHLRTDGHAFDTTVDLVVDAIRRREAELASPGGPPARLPSGSPPRRRPVAATPIATRNGIVIVVGSFVIRCLARVFTRVAVEGPVDEIPRRGGLLVAVNHASNADPVLVGSYLDERLGRPLNWMGKREVFDWPVIGFLARRAGVHPVERGVADVEAFRTAIRILESGHMLAVFPEGTRSPDGRLQAGRDGIAVLALRSGVTIVPIGIANADRLWPKGRLLPRRTPRVVIRVGSPFRLEDVLGSPTEGASRRSTNVAATAAIMRRIAALLPERQRGVYGDPPG